MIAGIFGHLAMFMVFRNRRVMRVFSIEGVSSFSTVNGKLVLTIETRSRYGILVVDSRPLKNVSDRVLCSIADARKNGLLYPVFCDGCGRHVLKSGCVCEGAE